MELDRTLQNRQKFKTKELKTTNQILTKIANKSEFREIRTRYKVHNFLNKVLTKNILNYILFAYYRKNKLTIAVFHPVGQSELNYQKRTIIKYAKETKEFKDIEEVSVFRTDMINPFNKKYSEKTSFKTFNTPFDKKDFSLKKYSFKERSYGIFENSLTNKELHEKVEEIRTLIKSS